MLIQSLIHSNYHEHLYMHIPYYFKLKESNDVEKTIKDYVHYYNNERPAYSLKYKTPIQFKTELRLSESFL